MIRRLIKVLPMSSVYFVTYVPGSTPWHWGGRQGITQRDDDPSHFYPYR